MHQIDKIMEMLDWNKSKFEQVKGIELAMQIEEITPFIQPGWHKPVWDNCAIILSRKSDFELQPYLTELLEWLQDMNWPGSFVILDRLKIFSSDTLIEPFLECINKATQNKDEEWLYNLTELVQNYNLNVKLPKEVILFLKEKNKEYLEND